MIDHVSLAVRDIKAAEAFYNAVLAPLGLTKLREWPNAAIGYGKKYPEFWINHRADMAAVETDSGVMFVCARRRQRRSMPFMLRRLPAAAPATARPAFARNTMSAITPPSFAISTATG